MFFFNFHQAVYLQRTLKCNNIKIPKIIFYEFCNIFTYIFVMNVQVNSSKECFSKFKFSKKLRFLKEITKNNS